MVRTFLSLLVLTLLVFAAAQAQRAAPSAWGKVCDRGALIGKDNDGKELRKDIDGCVTVHEQRDANLGIVLVGAYFYQCEVDGQEKQLFKVMVSNGIAVHAGIRLALVPKDLWDKVLLKDEKLENSDAARLDSLTLKLDFMPCRPEGCAAEMEPTSDFLAGLKSSGGLIVYVTVGSGPSIGLRVALAGFAQELEVEPFKRLRPMHPPWRLLQELGQELQRCAKGEWPESKRP